MADDIVTRLRHAEDNGICEWQVLIDAADEIERLRAERDEARAEASMKGYRLDAALDEIDRLRAAGDALALSIETFVPGVLVHISIKQAFTEWAEVRRG